MIHAVFFDLGWTLVKPASGHWYFTRKFFELFPFLDLSMLNEPAYKEAYDTAYLSIKEDPGMTDINDQIQRFTTFYLDFLNLSGIPHQPDIPEILAYDHATNMGNMELIETARETLRILKENGFYIASISDTEPMILNQLNALGIGKYFDQHTFSYQLGTTKPSPMMFHDALAKASVPARECLFIDDAARNLEAAEQFHIPSVQSLYCPHAVKDDHFENIVLPSEILNLI